MLHPHTELRNTGDDIGYGVFATRPIPRGTITWVLDPLDQVIDRQWAEGLEEPLRGMVERYTWVNSKEQRILCWDFARFMNHSCEANVLSPGGVEVDVAVRDIEAGEELTCDYGLLNLERAMECLCNAPSCRGAVKPEDLQKHGPDWDERLRAAFPDVTRVEQPLWAWLGSDEQAVRLWARRPQTMPSVLDAPNRASAPGRQSRQAG